MDQCFICEQDTDEKNSISVSIKSDQRCPCQCNSKINDIWKIHKTCMMRRCSKNEIEIQFPVEHGFSANEKITWRLYKKNAV